MKEHALILVNQITRGDPDFQEKLCLVGLLPVIVQLGPSPPDHDPSPVLKGSYR